MLRITSVVVVLIMALSRIGVASGLDFLNTKEHRTTTMKASALFLACMVVIAGHVCAAPAPVQVLFVGNSYTFGRVNPVMSYNARNITDLTAVMDQINHSGSNDFEPHPWGGVPGIVKAFCDQSGLNHWNISISARNAATLRGHFLETNPAGWRLRQSNIGGGRWDKVILQEQSDESVPHQIIGGVELDSHPVYFQYYANEIENWIHREPSLPYNYLEKDVLGLPVATPGGTVANCRAATFGGSNTQCNTPRNITANRNANSAAQVYLYETWARPNLVQAQFTSTTNSATGAITYTTTPATQFYPSLEAMQTDLRNAATQAVANAALDGSGGFAGIAPVGTAFMRAVSSGVATPNMYAPTAASDGLLDLWWDDGTHASKFGSYLSALVLWGTLTGLDPARVDLLGGGAGNWAARDLGISAQYAAQLQRVASDQLGYCPAGYTGYPSCTTNINECASEPCQNGGVCQDAVDGFTCQCVGPWGGVQCQTLTGITGATGNVATTDHLTVMCSHHLLVLTDVQVPPVPQERPARLAQMVPPARRVWRGQRARRVKPAPPALQVCA